MNWFIHSQFLQKYIKRCGYTVGYKRGPVGAKQDALLKVYATRKWGPLSVLESTKGNILAA